MNEQEVLRIIERAAEEKWDKLDLSKCNLKKFPIGILKLVNLKELSLRHNLLSEIVPEIYQLKNLIKLDISNNVLTEMQLGIYELKNIEVLNLGRNYLYELPYGISKLENLIALYLDDNNFTELPSDIGHLVKLKLLAVNENKLTLIPTGIQKLNSLNELWLKYNNIESVDLNLKTLTALRILDLTGNPINIPNTIIKESIYAPHKLFEYCGKHQSENKKNHNRIIDKLNTNIEKSSPYKAERNKKSYKFRNLNLRNIPEEVFYSKDIEHLDLQDNKIEEIPKDIKILKNLREIIFSNNKIEEIPNELYELTNLTALLLGYNKIRSISYEIEKLEKLNWLQIRYNKIKEIPKSIAKLKELRNLDARNNLIEQLPPEIGLLKNLVKLDLDNNMIHTLPIEIQNLTNLHHLELRDNPLPIPPEILAKTDEPQKILNYYFKYLKKEKKPLNEAKMLIVGQGAVGKTSLINRLVTNSFDQNETKTQGIDIKNWTIPINDKEIRLNVWDFGGQEIMHATHQFFLTKRSLYIIVLDSRLNDQENRLEYWLKIIQSFGGDSPVIVVCNKSDEQLLDLDWRGLQKKYPNIKSYARSVSCKTGEGIAELKTIIETETAALEHIHDELILSWFAVKNELEAMDRDYISYAEYQGMCETRNIHDDLSQQTLIGFLHDLGVVLHFYDHPVLEETNVLNPEWVTKGVYQILNSNLLFHSKGELDRNDLGRILDADAYPRNKHQFIIDMMRHFELCFDFSEYPNQRFLVPDLLSKEEPDTGDWTDSLAFQYHYDVLPGSIISRFIVRMRAFISKKTYWRNGVVLISENGNNRALVKADPEEKKIAICIDGRERTRRTFLAVIRADFRKIHASIPKLDVRQKVPLKNRPDIVVDYQHLLYLEEQGIKTYIPEGYRDVIQVEDLLNGIESKEQRQAGKDPEDDFRQSIYNIGRVTMDNINISAKGDVAFAKDQAFAQINKTISESANLPESMEENLKSLSAAVEAMLADMPEEKAKEVSEDLNTLVNEATKDQPRRKWYELSAEGLIEAARSVGAAGKPVIELTKSVMGLLVN